MAARAGAQRTGQVAALVLAGGRASRLGGTDKPGIEIAGRTLLAAVAGAAAGAGACHIVVVGPPRPRLADELAAELSSATAARPAIDFTTEHPPGAGPVPALRAGLGLVTAPWLLLLAADLPFLRDSHLRALRTAASAACGAMLVDDQGQPQWLASCWRTAVLRTALADYRGSSLGGVLGPLRPGRVRIAAEPDRAPPWLDCDTPEDVAAALVLARGKKGMR